jgi:hypothetical protein
MSTPTVLPDPLAARLTKVRRISLLVGAANIAALIVLALMFPHSAMPAYLVAFIYFVGIGIGSIGLLLLHNLVGGGWGMAIRRPLEAGAMTILPLALMFIPIVLFAGSLYPWVNPPEEMARLIAHKKGFLSVGPFAFRALFYFAFWGFLAFLLNRLADVQDRTDSPRATRTMQGFSGPALLAMFMTATFASIDWAMSLEPEWYSTIFAVLMIIGWTLTTFAGMILVAGSLKSYRVEEGVITTPRLNDLGNLMLAFTMLWAYMAFSQYLIIWAGNLAEEVPWFLRRSGPWKPIVVLLIIFHFFVPFLFLIVRESKRRTAVLMSIAAGLAFMHLLETVYVVLPSAAEDPLEPFVPWTSLVLVPVAVLGVGGLTLWTFLWFLGRRPLVPRHLPGLAEVHDSTPVGAH